VSVVLGSISQVMTGAIWVRLRKSKSTKFLGSAQKLVSAIWRGFDRVGGRGKLGVFLFGGAKDGVCIFSDVFEGSRSGSAGFL
jgi:hypothetical protein